MKTYSFSKTDLEFLQPVEANKQALDIALRAYISSVVFPRLGLKPTDSVDYNISEGTVSLLEEEDLKKRREELLKKQNVPSPVEVKEEPKHEPGS